MITTDKKYAFKYDPYKEVRVLCVDRNSNSLPVVILYSSGVVGYRTKNGKYLHGGKDSDYDLVPLKTLPDKIYFPMRNGELVKNMYGGYINYPSLEDVFKKGYKDYKIYGYRDYKIYKPTPKVSS